MRDERAVRGEIVKLRDDDFVGVVAVALTGAGVQLPEVTARAEAGSRRRRRPRRAGHTGALGCCEPAGRGLSSGCGGPRED